MPTVQACPACRTGVLARRGDPLCPTCMKAAREMPSRPSWLFDSPLLRQALAEVNLPAVPAIVRAACGVSQRDLAAMVGWSQAVLSYYERGIRDGMYDIRTVLQFADAVGMPRAALLPLVFADADVGLTAARGTAQDAERAGFGGLAAAAGLPVALPAVSAPRRADRAAHIRYWQACADVLYARDRSVGGTVLLPLAMQQWRRARLAAREDGGGETGSQLLAAAGELALCTGWIALDSGQLPLARPLYEEARELAAGSGDVVLGVHVLANQSMLHAELARTGPSREPARQALRLAFQAQDEGRYLPVPRLHALIALRHASAASLLGDKAAFQEAIAQARRELDRGPRGRGPARVAPVRRPCRDHRGGGPRLAEPRRPRPQRRAVPAGARIRAESPQPGQLRRGPGGRAAEAGRPPGRDQPQPQTSCPHSKHGVTSMRCLNRLRLVRQAAGSTPGAEEFCARFDAVERTLSRLARLPATRPPRSQKRTSPRYARSSNAGRRSWPRAGSMRAARPTGCPGCLGAGRAIT